MEGPVQTPAALDWSLDSFADLDPPKTNSIEDQSVAEIASLLVSANGLDGVDDVGQPLLVVTTHNGIASRSASARTAGRRPSAGTTSTGTPSTSFSSRSIRPNVTRLDRGDRSTRISTSLSGVSSPRATLPNTRTLEAPNFSAVASTCLRRCLRRRPSAVSGNPGSAPGAGSSRTSNRWPVAAISRSRVPNDGSRRPDSYALTTLWATCARRATSVCDRLARVRASRSSEPGERGDVSRVIAYSGLSIIMCGSVESVGRAPGVRATCANERKTGQNSALQRSRSRRAGIRQRLSRPGSIVRVRLVPSTLASASASTPAENRLTRRQRSPAQVDRVVTVLLECSETPGLGWSVTGMSGVAAVERGPVCRNLGVEWAVLGAL